MSTTIAFIPQRFLEPGSSIFLKKISKKYKGQSGGLLYRHGFKIAKNMKLALLGGPEVGEAAHQVKNLLATKRWEFYIHLVLEIKKHEREKNARISSSKIPGPSVLKKGGEDNEKNNGYFYPGNFRARSILMGGSSSKYLC